MFGVLAPAGRAVIVKILRSGETVSSWVPVTLPLILFVSCSAGGWTSDSAKVLIYFRGLDFFRATPGSGALKPGLDLAAATSSSTTNLRRVAGAPGGALRS